MDDKTCIYGFLLDEMCQLQVEKWTLTIFDEPTGTAHAYFKVREKVTML